MPQTIRRDAELNPPEAGATADRNAMDNFWIGMKKNPTLAMAKGFCVCCGEYLFDFPRANPV
jgi:hypothetical protein